MFRGRATLALISALTCCVRSTQPLHAAGADSHPNIILVTLDTTRADRMGFLGSKRGLTPNLDALARQSTVFTRAYAQVPLTTPSHATILTGTYPQFHHVNYIGDPLGKALPYLPAIFHKNGYDTAAFVGAIVLDPLKLAPGFDRGFDVYDAGFHSRRRSEDSYHSLERRGEEVLRRATAWLSKRRAGPFFLWIHLYDPHDPYTAPEPYRTRYAAQPYDGEIAYTDSVVGKLVTELRRHNILDSSVVAIVADHGEAFGEHGEQHHGIFLYDETIHVPLLVKLPQQRAAKKIENRVASADVAPTLLLAANLQVPHSMQGRSLLFPLSGGGAGQGPSDSEHGVYSESGYGHASFGWSFLKSWRDGNYLYVDAPEPELYDESVDLDAKHNLTPDLKAVTATAVARMSEFVQKSTAATAPRTQLTAEQAESLHALGYLTSDSARTENSKEPGSDPKQKVATANLLYQGMADTENARYQDAIPILEEVIKQEPHAGLAYLLLGRAYVALKQYENAIAPLQHVIEATPENSLAHYELGCALVKTGRWNEAAPQFEAAVSQMDSSSMMHFYLAMVYQRTSRNDEAQDQFKEALRLDPNNFAANLLLGRMYVIQQKASNGVPLLKKAASLRRDAIDPHRILADAYAQLGQEQNASRELSEAQRIQAQGGSRLGTPTESSNDPVPQP